MTCFAGALSFLIFLGLVLYILIEGVPHLRLSLFSPKYTTQNLSLFPALVSSVIVTFLSLLISAPIGIFAAIYLTEYAKKDNKILPIIRIANETLTGIPSIIFALFGHIFFVSYLKLGFSILSGSITLAIVVLPIIIKSTEQALQTVPASYKEGSFGLGAGLVRTIFRIILPAAGPGIFAGIILSIGRIFGETAALIYTAGTVPQIPHGKGFFLMSARTLAVHMYSLSNEGIHINEAHATAVVLLFTVILINSVSSYVSKKMIANK
jgi:phosphate transport system permease protein